MRENWKVNRIYMNVRDSEYLFIIHVDHWFGNYGIILIGTYFLFGINKDV